MRKMSKKSFVKHVMAIEGYDMNEALRLAECCRYQSSSYFEYYQKLIGNILRVAPEMLNHVVVL